VVSSAMLTEICMRWESDLRGIETRGFEILNLKRAHVNLTSPLEGCCPGPQKQGLKQTCVKSVDTELIFTGQHSN
jgi:hypothetical protein